MECIDRVDVRNYLVNNDQDPPWLFYAGLT